ncbi:MAG: hypothetical protein ACLFNU_02490 [Bacteroidales bacterium]
MKTIISVLLLILSTLPVFSQEVEEKAKEPVDTIILISGRKVPALVQAISTSRVNYIVPETDEQKEMQRRSVHVIEYRNGRVEHFNDMAVQMIDEGDWKTVILTDSKDDVEGLFALGEVEAQSSPRSRNAKSAQRSADIRIKKRAVNMGGLIVLVTKRESKGGYGEVPTHIVEGTVYGFEPPEE